MGNSTSGNQRAATTGRGRRARGLRPGLTSRARMGLEATRARLRAAGRGIQRG